MKNIIFNFLICIAEQVGKIERANMHSQDFMIVEGTTADGREFHVSLNVQRKKEDKTDGN